MHHLAISHGDSPFYYKILKDFASHQAPASSFDGAGKLRSCKIAVPVL